MTETGFKRAQQDLSFASEALLTLAGSRSWRHGAESGFAYMENSKTLRLPQVA